MRYTLVLHTFIHLTGKLADGYFYLTLQKNKKIISKIKLENSISFIHCTFDQFKNICLLETSLI